MLELADSFHLGWNGEIRASSNLVTYMLSSYKNLFTHSIFLFITIIIPYFKRY